MEWYKSTPYKQPENYVCATTSNRASGKRGKQPVLLGRVLTYWIRPAANSISITKRIGWHTFRHTFTNLLRVHGADIKTVQELLRHSSSRITLDIYSQAVTEDKRRAQSAVVRRLVQ